MYIELANKGSNIETTGLEGLDHRLCKQVQICTNRLVSKCISTIPVPEKMRPNSSLHTCALINRLDFG